MNFEAYLQERSVAMFEFNEPSAYCLTDAAMCLWEEALDKPEIMERLKDGEGAVAARDYVQTVLAPLCDLSWQYAIRVLGYDDAFDWEFVPEFLKQATRTEGRIYPNGLCQSGRLRRAGLHQTAVAFARSVVEALAAQ